MYYLSTYLIYDMTDGNLYRSDGPTLTGNSQLSLSSFFFFFFFHASDKLSQGSFIVLTKSIARQVAEKEIVQWGAQYTT